MSELSKLAQAMSQLREPEVMSLVRQMTADGVPVSEILTQCQEGMTDLGNRFDQGDCFIPELIVGGKIMESVMSELEPLLKQSAETVKNVGTVVMGTVLNDVHDIGKDIVVMMLRGSGFHVVDLGINVSPLAYVQAIQEHKPVVVGMSVLLTTCYKSIGDTVKAIENAGLRSQVSIMLGGAAATEILAEKTGCDYYGRSAMDGVTHACLMAHA